MEWGKSLISLQSWRLFQSPMIQSTPCYSWLYLISSDASKFWDLFTVPPLDNRKSINRSERLPPFVENPSGTKTFSLHRGPVMWIEFPQVYVFMYMELHCHYHCHTTKLPLWPPRLITCCYRAAAISMWTVRSNTQGPFYWHDLTHFPWTKWPSFHRWHMGQVTQLWLSCYLVLLSIDSKTR